VAEVPIVAILRGVKPEEVVAIAEALHGAGVRVVEVPLNSPDPLDSIRAADRLQGPAGVRRRHRPVARARDAVADAGGEIMVTPNTDPAVIRRALERGMVPLPGFATASEGFAALRRGRAPT
jgi:2-dehydro-3-deoxyphosphogalactonate aldolase